MPENKTPKKDRSLLLHTLGIFMWSMAILLSFHRIVSAQAFIQSYDASSQLQQGLIVQLSSNNSTVIPASQNNIFSTFGVVVNASDAPVSLSTSTSKSGQVYVASTGHYNLLVSDQNGPINSGNYITLSSVDGVGMRNSAAQPIVVGQAITPFNSSTPSIGTDTITTSTGSKETVHLGLI